MMNVPYFFVIFLFVLMDKPTQPSLPESGIPSDSSEKRLLSEQYVEKASRHRQGSYLEQQLLDTALMIDSTNDNAWMEKASWAIKVGDYIGFNYLIGKAIELEPAYHLGYRGWLKLYTLRDYEGALADFDRLDQLTPDFMDYPWSENIYYLRGLAYKQLGRYRQALANFTECIERTTTEMGAAFIDPYCYVYRGMMYLQLDSSQRASDDFDAALQLYEQCPEAHFRKGQMLLTLNQRRLACESFQKALHYAEAGYLKKNIYKEVFDEVYSEDIDQRLSQHCGDE